MPRPDLSSLASLAPRIVNQSFVFGGQDLTADAAYDNYAALHGTLFYFNRNKALTARNFFALTSPPFNRNEFGGMIGGPIIKNRTFFFGGYESLRERSPRTVSALPPGETGSRPGACPR